MKKTTRSLQDHHIGNDSLSSREDGMARFSALLTTENESD